jgi:hypothetical protein
MVGMYKNVWISVLLAKYTHCSLCNKQFRKREFNFSGSLQMVRVKMSPLTILLAEKRKKTKERGKKNADPFTFSRSLTRAEFFFSFFLSYITCMETTIEAKTLWYRASSDDAFLERVCSSVFFCYVLKRTSLHTLFSYFFLRASLTYHGQNKGKRDLFLALSLLFLHIYTQQKSSRVFFFE